MPKNKIVNRPFPWFVDAAQQIPGYSDDPKRVIDDDGYLVTFVAASQADQLVTQWNAMADNKAAQQSLMDAGFTLE